VLRPGAGDDRDVRLDLVWLLGLGLLVIGAGLGLRDPWPADEPRFALIARDMLATGDWLIPRVGGDLYPDKPPFYFWLMAASMALTGSMRVGFLVPSLLAGLGTLVLVYDLLRRVCNREAGLAGALLLLGTFQFAWQARQAQIDATLCLLTTLSLYGLLRYAFVEPRLRWWLLGWAAAGLGVITKGVGFLPLLALLPCGWLAMRGWQVTLPRSVGAWIAAPIAFLAAIAVWFVPMWIATSAGGELLAYRNEILFHQTVTRYAEAWHHHEPAWFYLVNVIPLLWLPAIALLPWAWPRWRRAARHREAFAIVLATWVDRRHIFQRELGKRGAYLLPAAALWRHCAVAAGPAACAGTAPACVRARDCDRGARGGRRRVFLDRC
jgi:4-amino-4-deoxy-L-arabinose transferase-like glycosyltransferase